MESGWNFSLSIVLNFFKGFVAKWLDAIALATSYRKSQELRFSLCASVPLFVSFRSNVVLTIAAISVLEGQPLLTA
jgi:hypothetical protein